MLAKKERLGKKDFLKYFSAGTRYQSPQLTLVFHPNDRFLAAAVVGKKTAKKAHERNTLRRRLYAAFEQEKVARALKGVYILIAKPPLFSLPRQKQREAARTLIGRTIKER
jgi:ribonuclease P protein component